MEIIDILKILDDLDVLELVDSMIYKEKSLIYEMGNPTTQRCKQLTEFQKLIHDFHTSDDRK